MHTLVTSILVLSIATQFVVSATDRPVIGIFTRTVEDLDFQHIIGASYVKWLESAGARTIPIHSNNTSDEEMEALFQNLNGVLLPGGHDFMTQPVRKMWQLANEANENGDRFPIWGACLGFQQMTMLASTDGESFPLGLFDSNMISLTLDFTEYGKTKSKMFAVAESIIEIAATKPINYNNHQDGVSPEILEADEGANNMFVITSTSVTPSGLRFVASIEARDFDTYPYFGVQFHPEKHAFEQSAFPGTDVPFNPAIDHSEEAILVSNALLKNFVSEARKSTHVYKDIDRFPLIWNYEIAQSKKFEQLYFIPSPKSTEKNHEQDREDNVAPAVASLRGISQESSVKML
mmetsp:Transcript_4026/g.5841  ORF Transcript_4026/g.5841 Transcript_4026/m.5841 type:complete len:348 (+) Transcript_4026:5024-6067(+)